MIDMVRGRGIYVYWSVKQRIAASCAFTLTLSAALWAVNLIN